MIDDTDRMDWLDRTGKEDGHGFCDRGYGEYRHYVFSWSIHHYKSARETIDAAIEAEMKAKSERLV